MNNGHIRDVSFRYPGVIPLRRVTLEANIVLLRDRLSRYLRPAPRRMRIVARETTEKIRMFSVVDATEELLGDSCEIFAGERRDQGDTRVLTRGDSGTRDGGRPVMAVKATEEFRVLLVVASLVKLTGDVRRGLRWRRDLRRVRKLRVTGSMARDTVEPTVLTLCILGGYHGQGLYFAGGSAASHGRHGVTPKTGGVSVRRLSVRRHGQQRTGYPEPATEQRLHDLVRPRRHLGIAA